jgi:prevent-host-death family protein
MKKVTMARATASLAEYVQQLGKQPLAVTSQGKPVAVLVPVEGMDLETLSLGTSPQFLDLIEASRRRHQAEGGISSEEIRREFGLKPYEETRSRVKGRTTPANSRKAKTTSRKRNGEKDGSQV